MASANPLRKIIDWFNASDIVEEEPTGGDPMTPPPASAAPEPSQKRQRGTLMLRNTTEGGMQIRHPRTLDDRLEVVTDLKHRRMVTLDLTHLPDGTSRYFLEFVYGVVHALDATMEMIADDIYLLAPAGVLVQNTTVPTDTPAPSPRVRERDVASEVFWQGK